MKEKELYNLVKSGIQFYKLPTEHQLILAEYCKTKYLNYRIYNSKESQSMMDEDFYLVFHKSYKKFQEKVIGGKFILQGASTIKNYIWNMIRKIESNEKRKRIGKRQRLKELAFLLPRDSHEEQVWSKFEQIHKLYKEVLHNEMSDECREILLFMFPDFKSERIKYTELADEISLEKSDTKFNGTYLATLRKRISRCKENVRRLINERI